MKFQVLTLIIVLSLLGFSAYAQKPNIDKILADVEKDGCAVTDDGKVKICKFDYKYKNQLVEALTYRPNMEDKFPAIMLIPGYTGTAKTYFSLAGIFAKLGFASMVVGTPGFGKTELKPDFLGENTINAYLAGYKKFEQETFVDKTKLGIFGYSRGAIAASLLITKIRDVKAAALGGGIYDLKKAYNEQTIEGIKKDIKEETGLTEKAFKERSAIFYVKKINCPVLIIHGEKDINAPTDQAYLFRDELKRLHKDVELQIINGQDHQIGSNLLQPVIDFFSLKLKGKVNTMKIH